MFHSIPFNIRGNADKGRELLDRLFEFAMEQPLNPVGRVKGALSSFRVDVTDTESAYELVAELPGFTKEEIKVGYDEERHHLTISAERPETETEGLKFLCRERRTGKFQRVFYVDEIAEDEAKVSYEQGLLKIVLPKAFGGKNQKIFDIE
ncbi:MAG: Hsp20 family protein [Selenomonadaceae bacterium]|nr:Hsp20 family protein [Selenomonadaceae bacterium]